jgi:colicin import membrane protein
MARKLKTYITNLGFFELAIAAPSMKAALEAWGMSHNAFQHGFAQQTDDPAIIAATNAHPGMVLKRAVGTSGAFAEDAELPKTLPNIRPPGAEKSKVAKPKVAKPKAAPKSPSGAKARPNPQSDRAAILSFEKARKARDRQRAEEDARSAKERAQRRRATGKAQAALDGASAAHKRIMEAIEKDRDKIDRRAQAEAERWDLQRKKLAKAVERSKID